MGDLLTGRPWAQAPWELVTAPISANAFRICMAIQLHRRPEGKVPFPGRLRLAAMCHVSEATVKRALQELREAGILQSEQRRTAAGLKTTNEYRLVLPRVTDDPHHGSRMTHGRGASPRVTDDPPEVEVYVSPRSKILSRSSFEEDAAAAASAQGEVVRRLVSLYCDTLFDRGVRKIPKTNPARVGRECKRLVNEGFEPELVAAAVQVVARRSLSPAAIPNLVMDVQAPKQNTGRRYGRGVTAQELFDEIRRSLDPATGSGIGDLFGGGLSPGGGGASEHRGLHPGSDGDGS